MENFFSRALEERWPRERRDDHWHVLLPPEIAWGSLEHPYEKLTAHDGLSPVPAEWMHITLDHKYTRVGDELARIRKRLGHVRQFRATIRRPEAWATAVVCPVYPVRPFAELREIVTGQPADNRFHPHLSLAYCTSRADTSVLRHWMSGRFVVEADIAVTEVSLVRQWHDGANIRWDLIETIPLETGARAAREGRAAQVKGMIARQSAEPANLPLRLPPAVPPPGPR